MIFGFARDDWEPRPTSVIDTVIYAGSIGLALAVIVLGLIW